jgi:hypothetical protein
MIASPSLFAIGDLHLGLRENRELLMRMSAHPGDWLIVAGDVGETEEHLELAWSVLTRCFARVLWVPGNHELWALPGRAHEPRGEARYLWLVDLCRRYGVATPEDPYPLWEGAGGPCLLAPLFLLYDYSFRPAHVTAEGAIAWAMESGILCTDEKLLLTDPHPSVSAWCHYRLGVTEPRLIEAAARHPLVLVNHFPLRADLVRIPAIPRFSIWCGSRRSRVCGSGVGPSRPRIGIFAFGQRSSSPVTCTCQRPIGEMVSASRRCRCRISSTVIAPCRPRPIFARSSLSLLAKPVTYISS